MPIIRSHRRSAPTCLTFLPLRAQKCRTPLASLRHDSTQSEADRHVAFVRDPDGYRIELIETGS